MLTKQMNEAQRHMHTHTRAGTHAMLWVVETEGSLAGLSSRPDERWGTLQAQEADKDYGKRVMCPIKAAKKISLNLHTAWHGRHARKIAETSKRRNRNSVLA